MEQLVSENKPKSTKPKAEKKEDNPQYQQLSKQLEEAIGKKVKIADGKLTIFFNGEEELYSILERLH